jgi:hypothetical protein
MLRLRIDSASQCSCEVEIDTTAECCVSFGSWANLNNVMFLSNVRRSSLTSVRCHWASQAWSLNQAVALLITSAGGS